MEDVTWQQATTQVYNLNTIATLTFHINYYISAVLKVLQGEPLNAKDEYSFNHPPIASKKDWDTLLNKVFSEAEVFANSIEKLPETKLYETFQDEKYGNYYRNLVGIIEHSHYHLGQISLIKKILQETEK